MPYNSLNFYYYGIPLQKDVEVPEFWVQSLEHSFPMECHCLIFRVLAAAGGIYQFTGLKDEYENMLISGCDSPYLMSFLVDFYDESLEQDSSNKNYLDRSLKVIYYHFFVSFCAT